MSQTFLACLAHTNLLAHPQHPTNHIVIAASGLDDRHGVYDREVATVIITNEDAVDVDEYVAIVITIKHGGVGGVEVAGLMNGADDGVIVVAGETMVITMRRLQHTRLTDIDVIAVRVDVV